METYSLLREFADSWVLLLMTMFYLSVFVWVFRPGSKKTHQDAANIPFRSETLEPVGDVDRQQAKSRTVETHQNEATS